MPKYNHILILFGTRPEAIKLAPVITAFRNKKDINISVCSTGQHKEMLKQITSFFDIKIDIHLDLMTRNQSLASFASKCMLKLDNTMSNVKPDLIMVQGDTSSAFIGGLVGFYNQIDVAHVEAGLRSYDINSPFPEELNRVLLSKLAKYHFVPTPRAEQNLRDEGVSKHVYNVGNTVIDALQAGIEIVSKESFEYTNEFEKLDFEKKIVLVTAHRRENVGQPLVNICNAINELAHFFGTGVQIVYPVHLNPKVRQIVDSNIDSSKNNIFLLSPLDYPDLIFLMNHAHIILTDSGGIQEEGPTLSKPVLVLRENTERQEGVESGTAQLVGTNAARIVDAVKKLMQNTLEYNKMAIIKNPYGDGNSSERIVDILTN